MGNKDSALSTVAVFTDPLEAHLLRGRLKAERIPAFVVNEYHIGAIWMLANVLGGVRVQVPSSFRAEAEVVVNAHLRGEYERVLCEQFDDVDVEVCPRCGAEQVQHLASQ